MADKRPMMSLDEVLGRLLAGAQAHPVAGIEAISTFDALGRVLAEPVVSALDVPPSDNTSMDGYALHVDDVPAAELARLTQGHAIEFTGEATNHRNKPRTVTGRAQPAGANSGKIKVRIMADGIELIFNGSYQLTAGHPATGAPPTPPSGT